MTMHEKYTWVMLTDEWERLSIIYEQIASSTELVMRERYRL